jgi:hypothetical protein
VDKITDKALAELLTTREVDVSELIAVKAEKNKQAKEPPVTDDLRFGDQQLTDSQAGSEQSGHEPYNSEGSARAVSAEETADLMNKHVEAVVAHLVEIRLPFIVERIIAEQIRQIKALTRRE